MDKKNSKPNSYGEPPKMSMVIRVIIVIVALCLFLGAIIFPFMASGIFG